VNPGARSIDETHDPRLVSWVESAQLPGAEFPIQNLPFGVFRARERLGAAHDRSHRESRIGVAIGDRVLDLARAASDRILGELAPALRDACTAPRLDALLALGPPEWSLLRRRLSETLRFDAPARCRRDALLRPRHELELLVPATVGDFTDFYSSIEHATNVGRLFRPDRPLLANYRHLPIAYHGRASSIVASGTPVRRPRGQRLAPGAERPEFGPSEFLDWEVELGFWIGRGNPLGEPIDIDRSEEHVFGLCVVNDWSARDIQSWEYQPLGPFLAKSFATTISPWVVTLEALAPYRVAAREPDDDAPLLLSYLRTGGADRSGSALGAFDVELTVELRSAAMATRGDAPFVVSRQSARGLYWTLAQMVAHHTSGGCNLRPGDLLASGTISGSDATAFGSLLEITQRGDLPLRIPGGETRRGLADGDEVTMHGACGAPGRARIGFGDCRGVVLPALA